MSENSTSEPLVHGLIHSKQQRHVFLKNDLSFSVLNSVTYLVCIYLCTTELLLLVLLLFGCHSHDVTDQESNSTLFSHTLYIAEATQPQKNVLKRSILSS